MFNNFSKAAFYIELVYINEDSLVLVDDKGLMPREKVLANATGFFFRYQNRSFLITAWHNATGVNSETGKRLDEITLGSPNTIIIIPQHEKYQNGTVDIGFKPLQVDLYDREGRPKWYIHPKHKHRVDVIALEVPSAAGIIALNQYLPRRNAEKEDIIRVGDDVFVLGFPLPPKDFSANELLPIWKRGSIATEPDQDIGELPKMLVDTASRKGMSGSPVIAKYEYHLTRGKDGKLTKVIDKEHMIFCGVYSGRINKLHNKDESEDSLDTQLGIIWKTQVIEEIIEGACLDTKNYCTGQKF